MSVAILHNEKEWLAMLQNGSEQAFDQIVNHYKMLVRSFIARHVRRTDWIDEITNDVFMQLWIQRETIAKIDDLNKYLFVLCKNRAINVMKAELRDATRNHNWYYQQAVQEESERDLQMESSLQLVDDAINTLTERQREVWILSRRKKLTYDQIADALHIGRESVKSHIQAANQSIKKYVLHHSETVTFAVLLLLWLS